MPVLPKKVVLELGHYDRPSEGRYGCVRLDFNENTEVYSEACPGGMPPVWVNSYPEYGAFTKRIADLYGVSEKSVTLTNGSDEGISVIASTFIEPNVDGAVVSDPCFSMIPHNLIISGAKLIRVPVRTDLSFDVEGISAALATGVKLAMFATPENPTGAVLQPEQVVKWCEKFPATLFVIDEAYGEFGPGSMLSLISRFDNLLILKTFSKAWGLAGLRLGLVFGQEQVIELLERVKSPFSVNAAAIWSAGQLLDKADQVKDKARKQIDRLAALAPAIQERGFGVVTGSANSLLMSAGIHAHKLTSLCKENSVLVRNRSGSAVPPFSVSDNGSGNAEVKLSSRFPLWGKIRVNVGTESEHDRFLKVIDRFRGSYGVIFDLDGTLADTSRSFDRAVHDLVLAHSGKELKEGELNSLRAEGGFNDDWVATVELLRRRGVATTYTQIAPEGLKRYLEVAPASETLMCDLEMLARLRRRHKLFIVTGRARCEFEPVWGSILTPAFDGIYCVDDRPDLVPKPAPDFLQAVMKDFSLTDGVYVGNAVDDMQSAVAAGIERIGVTTEQSAEVLESAGALFVLGSVSQLTQVFQI
jgi:histidinol-phosphate aminotransferase